jgi:sulfur carrier protein ThiS
LIIHVKTVGTLKSLEEGTELQSLDVPAAIAVSQVMDRLGLKDWEIGFVLINGTRVAKESILKENDNLTLIAPLAGG